ncbi:hypothetical protein [Actinomycetospora soli]|uniref:hypothetical protein n=1 Tax=Actinomycetospora soli TaxID=2893887 RepID=UPI001E3729F8|nr:hypothetical protein [Actinomycetospora soli]
MSNVSGRGRSFVPVAAAVGLPAAAPAHGRMLQRLGLLVLAIFVVVMHHVVGAHAHGEGADMASHAAAGVSSFQALPTATDSFGGHVATPGSAPARFAFDTRHASDAVAGTAEIGSPDPMAGGMAMVHLCLAVLAAVVALAALLLLASALGAQATSTSTSTGWLPLTPRPPPSQRRQARLQVLRL